MFNRSSLNNMSLEERVGQVVIYGGIIGGIGSYNKKELYNDIKHGRIGGVYLGYPHFKNPEEAYEIHKKLQSYVRIPLFCASDMETGLGYIMDTECCHFPYLMGLGATNDEVLVEKVGRIVGRQARALGFNFNFGPCVDVNSNPENPIIGIRSFGENVKVVSKMAKAYIKGCQSQYIVCSAKHFPGTGDTKVDQHLKLEVKNTSIETLMKREIVPFKTSIDSGVYAIMSTHMGFSTLDSSGMPATLSKPIMTDLLRDKLKFKGVVISDSMGMDAICCNFSREERYIKAFNAGCDILLSEPKDNPFEILLKALKEGNVSIERLNEAVNRIIRIKKIIRLDTYKPYTEKEVKKIMEDKYDKAIMGEVGRKAISILKNRNFFPLRQNKKDRLFIIQKRDSVINYFLREKEIFKKVENIIREKDPMASKTFISRECFRNEINRIVSIAQKFKEIIFIGIAKNFARDPYGGMVSPTTFELLNILAEIKNIKVGVLIFGSPYLLKKLNKLDAYLCTYGECEYSVIAAFRVIYLN